MPFIPLKNKELHDKVTTALDKTIFRTPSEWLVLNYPGLAVYDPDGWRGPNGRSWDDPISEAEFEERFVRCTIGPNRR
jgi:hypothetical protein